MLPERPDAHSAAADDEMLPAARSAGWPARWLTLAALVIALDQLSKWAILAQFDYGERTPVIAGLFDLTLVYNKGAAFSFLDSAGGWQRWFFTGLGIAASALITRLLWQHQTQTLYAGALALIMGGALGNVIDRLIHAKVVDFLLFYQGDWYFPAFNVADSAIAVGAFGLLASEFVRPKKRA